MACDLSPEEVGNPISYMDGNVTGGSKSLCLKFSIVIVHDM